MNPASAPFYLQLISSAVTPVVMISACSGLLITINSRHNDLSSRQRMAAADIRHAATNALRRKQLLTEVDIFHRRFLLLQTALICLYSAVGVFLLTTLLILLSSVKMMTADRIALSLFAFGSSLVLVAVICQVTELTQATSTLRIELSDLKNLVESVESAQTDSTAPASLKNP